MFHGEIHTCDSASGAPSLIPIACEVQYYLSARPSVFPVLGPVFSGCYAPCPLVARPSVHWLLGPVSTNLHIGIRWTGE